jgi:hypothetical protein
MLVPVRIFRMSNNPGKKGKPAPWVLRERADREAAWDAFEREHAPAAYWLLSYREAEAQHEKEAKREIPTFARGEKKAWEEKHGWGTGDNESYRRWGERRKLVAQKRRQWFKDNPCPYTEEIKADLTCKFNESYVPLDRS